MDFGYKLWLEEEDKKIFGRGPMELLKKIDELGSLRKASIHMNMSYSKAWNLIKDLEDSLSLEILEKKIGGQQGGGSSLTQDARNLIDSYSKFSQEADKSIRLIFEKYFKDMKG